jgi:hypothetical protein
MPSAPSLPRCAAALLALALTLVLTARAVRAQAFVVSGEQVEGRLLHFQPTAVPLPHMHAGPFTHEALIRALGSEQGFAMRPLPLGSKGLRLVANGPMSPAGEAYEHVLDSKGFSSRPGDRVTITRITFHPDQIVFETNGGPDLPHKYLRHLQVGAGGGMMPMVQDHGEQADGSRITLVFPGGVPNITGDEAKALLAPLIGFGEKSPIEAYTATMPAFLKKAVLAHHVLVGMNRDMVLHTVGPPEQKSREATPDGSPFEVWIYGTPPEQSQFIRFENNRVVRVEDAAVGKPPVLRAANEMGDYWETQAGLNENERLIKLGDQSEADREAQNAPPAPPPSLRKPGEALPADRDTKQPTMRPVQFPTDSPASAPTSAPQ